MRKDGFDIFHDIIFDGFNIDHVVISKYGIFCIETKTYSKPEKGEAKINYDGNTVVVNGYSANAPVIQVKAASKTLQELFRVLEPNGYAILVVPIADIKRGDAEENDLLMLEVLLDMRELLEDIKGQLEG